MVDDARRNTSNWERTEPADAVTTPIAHTFPGLPIPRRGRIRQSVAKWCFPRQTLDELCACAYHLGLDGIDLLQPSEFHIPRQYGLVCTMGYVDAGTIENGLNRIENHAAIEARMRINVPLAAKAAVRKVITFSGNRSGISDEEGARNTVIGLNRVKKIAEDNGVVLCLELLNSIVDHPDYMADHTAWGVRVMEQVNSPNVKLLYDFYHMQIMEGNLIATFRSNVQWIAHVHMGGVPGRHELNGPQEVQWDEVMRAIAATTYSGYVVHEFLPTGDPFNSLLEAANLCDV